MREYVALFKGYVNIITFGILLCNPQGIVGDIPGGYLRFRKFRGQGDGDTATARTDIKYVSPLLPPFSFLLSPFSFLLSPS